MSEEEHYKEECDLLRFHSIIVVTLSHFLKNYNIDKTNTQPHIWMIHFIHELVQVKVLPPDFAYLGNELGKPIDIVYLLKDDAALDKMSELEEAIKAGAKEEYYKDKKPQAPQAPPPPSEIDKEIEHLEQLYKEAYSKGDHSTMSIIANNLLHLKDVKQKCSQYASDAITFLTNTIGKKIP